MARWSYGTGVGACCQNCEGEQCLSGESQCDSPKAGFAAWMTECEDPTHEELVERLGKVAMVATAEGTEGWATRLSRLWLR